VFKSEQVNEEHDQYIPSSGFDSLGRICCTDVPEGKEDTVNFTGVTDDVEFTITPDTTVGAEVRIPVTGRNDACTEAIGAAEPTSGRR
jgi:hypothetical protein